MARIKLLARDSQTEYVVIPVLMIEGKEIVEISVDGELGAYTITFASLGSRLDRFYLKLQRDGTISLARTDLIFDTRAAAAQHLSEWLSARDLF